MPLENGNQSEANEELKERVRAFWQTHPCGTKFSDAEMGTRAVRERTANTLQAVDTKAAAKRNVTQAIERIRDEIRGCVEVNQLVEFIESSKRGVVK